MREQTLPSVAEHERDASLSATATGAPADERIDYATVLPHRTKLVILAGVLLSLFLSALDQTIVATAQPAIIAEFRGIDLLSWVSTGYLLASTTMVPIYGKLSDLYGRRIVLIFGIVVFLIGSSLCGIAGSMIQLILFRVVQGIGAAALTSTAFAIPADLFAPSERARYQGLFGAVFGLSSVIGPYLGGLLTDSLSWRWVFYVNLPLGLIALAFIVLKMPRLASGIQARIDWLGAGLLVTAVVPLLLGLTLDKTVSPWTSPLILGLFAVALVATTLFLFVELRAESPIIPLELFRNRTFAVVCTVSFLSGGAFFAAVLFLSLFMVNVVGVSATAAGTTLIPLTLGLVFGSVVASSLVQRIGRYKPIILLGFAIMLLGFVWVSQMDTTVTRLDVTLRMIVIGLGIGPALPLLNLALQNAVPFEKVGTSTASRQFFLQIGQTLGAAIFGVILSTTLTSQLNTNFTPVLAQLPAEARSGLDLSQLRNGATGTEGGGEQIDLPAQIEGGIKQQFAARRAEVTATQPADAAETQAALQQIDTAEAQALEQGATTGARMAEALRQSFATSITSIYFYASFLVLAALLLTLLLPEIPLRTSNRPDAAPAFE